MNCTVPWVELMKMREKLSGKNLETVGALEKIERQKQNNSQDASVFSLQSVLKERPH